MSWSLDQTDPYAYTLLDTRGDAVAQLNFYDTNEDPEIDTHWIATLVATAPELLYALQYYYEHGDNDKMRKRTCAILKLLDAMPKYTGWGTT